MYLLNLWLISTVSCPWLRTCCVRERLLLLLVDEVLLRSMVVWSRDAFCSGIMLVGAGGVRASGLRFWNIRK
jgi:hypothetical protein